ncbi:hypothetical protein [Aurantiacibacter marinus]|uniref:hypothetical protein n=1 Tax=Aurantiacibacter marinus TaxID=874156 RepID=UPI001E2C9344|nr:hypothetical protein [Aurantiacibacter marinus]
MIFSLSTLTVDFGFAAAFAFTGFAADLVGAAFLGAGFALALGAGFLAAGFLATAFLATTFLATGFLTGAFFAAAFFAGVFATGALAGTSGALDAVFSAASAFKESTRGFALAGCGAAEAASADAVVTLFSLFTAVSIFDSAIFPHFRGRAITTSCCSAQNRNAQALSQEKCCTAQNSKI